MMLKLSPFILIPLFISCSNNSGDAEKNEPVENSGQENQLLEDISDTTTIVSSYSSETFQNENGTWGYRILMDGSPYIQQPHIPAVSGNKGFSTEEKARKTADLAVTKLELGFFPPTISIEELDSLDVLN